MRAISIAAILAIIAVSLSGASAWSNKHNNLGCPNVTTVDLNWADYLGVWYEIGVSTLARETFELGCECTHANYTSIDSTTVGVENTCNINSPSGSKRVADGNAKITGPGKLAVTFSAFSPRSPYWIIQYDGSYAVVWSCFEVFGVQVGATMWVLNRQPTMDPAQVTAVLAKAAQQTGFDISTVTPTVQKGCTY